MPILTKIIIASLVGGLFSLVGGVAILSRPSWVRKFTIHFISFAIGALLATALLDLLPEALEFADEAGLPEPHSIFIFVLAGFLGFFILEKLIFKFHPHHHEHLEEEGAEHHHHPVATLLLIGDTAHNFIDGVLIAITFLAEPALGVLTTVAVAAHEIPQEIGDFSVMLAHGWSRAKVLWANIGSSLMSLAGAILAFFARDFLGPVLPQLLALTAGVFIYIAAVDLIPDVSHERSRDKLSHILILLLLGILAVGFLGFYLEGH